MTITLAATLIVLALIDSTSFGTLLIPIWLLLAPGRLRAGRVLVFLGTVAMFYFAVGLVLSAGAGAIFANAEALQGPVAARVQFVLGAGLLVMSFFIGKKKLDSDGKPKPGRMLRWRDKAMAGGDRGSTASLITLALGAAVLEAATMLPYLAAIGLITAEGLAWGPRVGVLAAYCIVMIAPALVLLLGRIAARRAIEPMLNRIALWMEKAGGETTAWIVGILGFLIARDAFERVPELAGLL